MDFAHCHLMYVIIKVVLAVHIRIMASHKCLQFHSDSDAKNAQCSSYHFLNYRTHQNYNINNAET